MEKNVFPMAHLSKIRHYGFLFLTSTPREIKLGSLSLYIYACACKCLRLYMRMYTCGFYIYIYLDIVFKNEDVYVGYTASQVHIEKSSEK